MIKLSGFLALCLSLLNVTLMAGTPSGFLPHLTPAHARVQTTLIFFNPTNTAQTVHLRDTVTQQTFSVELNAGEGLRLSAAELNHPRSLAYELSSAEVDVKLSYASHLMARDLTVPPATDPATNFRFEAMDTHRLWQGFVALNVGGEPTDVTVFQYSADGELLGELPIAYDLSPGFKAREVLNNFDWEVHKGSYFELVATQPVSVVMLYGTYLNDGNASMRIANGTAIKAPRMRFTRPNGDHLIVTPSAIYFNQTERTFSDFDQIWNQFQTLKLAKRTSAKQTNALFTAQFERGEHSNSWTIDQGALMQDYNAVQAADLIEQLFRYAE